MIRRFMKNVLLPSNAAHAGYDCNGGKRKQKGKGEEIDVSLEIASACVF